MSNLVVLDNEAVGALAAPTHPKHRRAIAHIQVIATRKRRSTPSSVVVPTAVRVEAGLDRRSADAAFFGSLRIRDLELDRMAADIAATIRADSGVSVADAHIGAVIATTDADRVTVLTSDPHDIRRVSGTKDVTIVRL